MRVLIVGATGLLGTEIARILGPEHEVIAASRKGSDVPVDLSDKASIAAMYSKVGNVGAVLCVGGTAKFAPLDALSDDDYAFSLANKLMGQVNLVRCAIGHVDEGGCITLTSGTLAQQPMVGSAAVSIVNAGVEGFARAAALELQGKMRVNVVSPRWVAETLQSMGKDPSAGIPAVDVARAYKRTIDEPITGQVLLAAKG
ncbi:short chain dehydrogenase [Caballeronia sp. LZ062]|uniref:short chain dehydrogenase n=1 Tax=unclassified Caballeronia TaxID=2646786 RepID=UPI00286640EE|nr:MULTISPECIES: short chain dehydrogenase [unclassified Caballeronia]MDR5854281.1 short chain dehydrogenase [Caballeronia sp. LZ050]MDR5871188.1 short chain dehydrogenase [Caballeronia sp. LZ062]